MAQTIVIGGTTSNANVQDAETKASNALIQATAANNFTPTFAGAVSIPLASLLGDLSNLRSAGAALGGQYTDAGVFTGPDDTAKVQAMFNAAGSFNTPPIGLSADWGLTAAQSNSNNMPQGEVHFPRGCVFNVNGTIRVPPGVRVRGNSSVVLQNSKARIPTFSCQYTRTQDGAGNVAVPYQAYSCNSFHDLHIWGGAGDGSSLGTGIRMGAAQDFEIDNCLVGGFRVGLDLWAVQYSSVDNCQIQGNVHNIIVRNYPTNATVATDSTGGPSPSIDFRITNSRAAKSVNGYGLWIQNAANVVVDQLDANFCGKAALVCGGALPDYLSRILAFTSGAGYTPGSYPLTVTDSKGAGFLGYAVVGSSGTVTSAYITEGIGSGAGVSSGGPSISLSGAGTPSTAATFTASIQRDNTAFADLIDSAVSRSYGDLLIRNFKAETAGAVGGNGTVGAPDCGYVMFGDANGGVRMSDVKLSTYARSADNYYRYGYFQGGAELDFAEWSNGNAYLTNPGVAIVPRVLADVPNGKGYSAGNPGDYGLFRCTASARIVLPDQTDTANFTRLVIDINGNPSVGGTQVFLKTTNADAEVLSGLHVRSGAYSGNPRLHVFNTAPQDLRTPVDAFTVDGSGKTSLTGLSSPPIVVNYAFYTTTMVVDFSVGMNQTCTLNNSGVGGSNTISLQGGIPGSWYLLEVAQDGTGSRTATFSNGNIRWQGGTVPVLSTGANKVDLFRFYYDGSSWFGQAFLGF